MTKPVRDFWSLDPNITFLNHGSFGACPNPVMEAQQEIRARMELEPLRFFRREHEALLDNARQILGHHVGASPKNLVFVTNATGGGNTILQSLEFKPSENIVITDHAYGSCRNAVEFVAKRWGASVIVAKIPFPLEDPSQANESILAAVTPETRLVLLDHITSPTALVMPIAATINELNIRGVETLVDGAHGAGMIPLNLDQLGATYYTGNCHKWLCAPKGAAFLWVDSENQSKIRPLQISQGVSHAASTNLPTRSKYWQAFDWTGTHDPSAYLSIPHAIEFLSSLHPKGLNGVMEQNRNLTLQARDLLSEMLGIVPPAPEEMIGSMVSLLLPEFPGIPVDPHATIDPLQDLLFLEHHFEVPIIPWNDSKQRMIRTSSQMYNDLSQYEALGQTLKSLL